MTSQLKRNRTSSFISHLICLLFFISLSNETQAQSETTFIKAKYGIAITDSGEKIRFKFVKETENSFVFITRNNTKIELEKYKVAQINKQKGTKGFRYAITAIGATTLVVVHAYYIDVQLTGGGAVEEDIFIISTFFSLFTGTVNGLIGLTQKRYKTIYTSPTFGNYESNLKLKTTSPNTIPSFTLSYTF